MEWRQKKRRKEKRSTAMRDFSFSYQKKKKQEEPRSCFALDFFYFFFHFRFSIRETTNIHPRYHYIRLLRGLKQLIISLGFLRRSSSIFCFASMKRRQNKRREKIWEIIVSDVALHATDEIAGWTLRWYSAGAVKSLWKFMVEVAGCGEQWWGWKQKLLLDVSFCETFFLSCSVFVWNFEIWRRTSNLTQLFMMVQSLEVQVQNHT